MDNSARKHQLRQGFLTASIPAVLFFPAVAFLTICPPKYGLVGMRTMAAAFLFAEIWAGWKLLRVLERRLDWVNGLAVLGLVVAVLVLAATAWGFIAPIRASRSGHGHSSMTVTCPYLSCTRSYDSLRLRFCG